MASGGVARELTLKEADIQKMLAAEVHLGTKNCDFQMERYVFKRRNDGTTFFTLHCFVYIFLVCLFAHVYINRIKRTRYIPLVKHKLIHFVLRITL